MNGLSSLALLSTRNASEEWNGKFAFHEPIRYKGKIMIEPAGSGSI